MNVEAAREYCLSKKAATECLPFDEYSLVMKVMGKMFAMIDLESADHIVLKCAPERALDLRERDEAYSFQQSIMVWRIKPYSESVLELFS